MCKRKTGLKSAGPRLNKMGTTFSDAKNRGLISRIGESFANGDMYAEPIQFNFRGKVKFTSGAGGIISFLVRVSLVIFLITKALQVVDTQNEDIKYADKLIDSSDEAEPLPTLGDLGYDFLIGSNLPLKATIGAFSIYAETYENGVLVQRDLIPSALCDYQHPAIELLERETRMVFADDFDFECPRELEKISLKNSYIDNKNTRISIVFEKCQTNPVFACADQEVFDSWLDNARIYFFSLSNTMLMKDRPSEGRPVYSRYEKIFEKELQLDRLEVTTINLKYNEVQLYDNVLANILSYTDSWSFYTYDSQSVQRKVKIEDFTKPGTQLFVIELQMNPLSGFYFRQTCSVWEVLALAGGFAVFLVYAGKVAYKFVKSNSMYVLTQAFMSSQYQTRTRKLELAPTKQKDQREKEAKEAEDKAWLEEQIDKRTGTKKEAEEKSDGGDSASIKSNDTIREIEKEIERKDLKKAVEEICDREKYKFKLDSVMKRYCSCKDNERDEIIKKLRNNGERKLLNELDISRMLRKIRNYEILNSYLLTDRQRFLMKFNDKHVIDSDSDLISLESAQSLFSADSEDKNKDRTIRQRVMVKLLDDLDPRNPECGYRLLDRDLETGVGKNILEQSKSSSDEESSEMIDSARIKGQIADKAKDEEIAPDVIGAPEATPSSSLQRSSVSQSEYGSESQEDVSSTSNNDNSAIKPIKGKQNADHINE